MPQFTTISPTSVPGKKEYAWRNFLRDGYAAIGWLSHTDLTGKSLDEIERLLENEYPDEPGEVNLGIFYEDNAAKKRWVLKCDSPKELAEVEAVFVTVEPQGGSREPSGKPLLYAYLKVSPNHP